MIELAVLTALLAPAAPVPVGPPAPPDTKIEERQAHQFAVLVDNLALQVREYSIKDKLDPKELLEAAVRGLYDEIGKPVPDTVTAAVRRANTQADRVTVLAEVRMQLGNHPGLAGSRSLFAAMNGFRHATDPICGLSGTRISSYVSIEQDFGLGIELEGVTGSRWSIYQVEHGIATGLHGPYGYIGARPKPDAIPSPAVFPWRVRRVIPGSPAQKAGVKPGDLITHYNGTELAADNADRLFAAFAYPKQTYDPQTGQAVAINRTLTFRREGDAPLSATLKSDSYTPESAFGVIRADEGKWDCLLDRKHKIGYIRIGPVESGLNDKVAAMLADLDKQGCRALILDLRWCPGGYVDPGKLLAGLFLDDGEVIAKMKFTSPRAGQNGDILAPIGGGKYAKLPLALLVGPETTGGGELIASALRDNDPDGSRCVVVGQRSAGRATIQNTLEAGFGQMQFRITTGTSLRPNGKSRQRLPDSQPTDDWGIRPDDGLEVPLTADKAAELRRQAELHALRPANSREALPFDDPNLDPYRLTALVYLRKKLGPPK